MNFFTLSESEIFLIAIVKKEVLVVIALVEQFSAFLNVPQLLQRP